MLQLCRGLSGDHSWGDIEGGKEEDVVRIESRLMHAGKGSGVLEGCWMSGKMVVG